MFQAVIGNDENGDNQDDAGSDSPNGTCGNGAGSGHFTSSSAGNWLLAAASSSPQGDFGVFPFIYIGRAFLASGLITFVGNTVYSAAPNLFNDLLAGFGWKKVEAVSHPLLRLSLANG